MGGLDLYGVADDGLLDNGFLWRTLDRWPWDFWCGFRAGDFDNLIGIDGVCYYLRNARDVFLYIREFIIAELCEFAFVFLIVVEGFFLSSGAGEKGGYEEYGY